MLGAIAPQGPDVNGAFIEWLSLGVGIIIAIGVAGFAFSLVVPRIATWWGRR